MNRKLIFIAGAVVVAGGVAASFMMPHMHHGMDHSEMVMPANATSAEIGELALSNGFAYATLPNQPVGAGFVTLTNTGSTADRLVAASSPIAGRMEIHTMLMNDGVMQMRELEEGLLVPAGETVAMQPGGFHMMFMQLNDAMVEGDMAPVTLTFEGAGRVAMMLPINKRMASGGHSGHQGH